MISLTVNGEARTIEVDPETPLLWVLRDQPGLTGTKYGCGITQCGASVVHVDGGGAAESDFHDFPLLRMDEMPAVEAQIVKSEEAPGGVGEPVTPPIAPAAANAVFAATGVAVRSLPIRLS